MRRFREELAKFLPGLLGAGPPKARGDSAVHAGGSSAYATGQVRRAVERVALFGLRLKFHGQARSVLGKGFLGRLGRSNLRNYRQIALTWPRLGIRQTPSGESRLPLDLGPAPSGSALTAGPADAGAMTWQDEDWMARLRGELSFSHLLELSRVGDPLARAFYEMQALAHRWSLRELKRQRDSMLFERVGLSRDREAVLALANEGRLPDTPRINIRDPYVLEFLGLPEKAVYSEADLESALVEHLQQFLLELGGDFAFLARQYRVTVGGRHHFIDLLFFHRRLRCLVAIDLKIGAFGHEDAGQMNFYLGYLRENVCLEWAPIRALPSLRPNLHRRNHLRLLAQHDPAFHAVNELRNGKCLDVGRRKTLVRQVVVVLNREV